MADKRKKESPSPFDGYEPGVYALFSGDADAKCRKIEVISNTSLPWEEFADQIRRNPYGDENIAVHYFKMQ